MKRMIHTLMAAAVLVSAMTCTAFAATEGYTEDKAGVVDCTNTETLDYTASYAQAIAGNQYVLLVVKTDENGQYDLSKAENILYIDQKQAESADISFNVLPMAEKVAYSEVLLGGIFADGVSPKTLGFLLTPSEEEPEPQLMIGDINGDGEIKGRDSQMLLRHVAEVEFLTDDQLTRADINGDGSVKGRDSQLLLRHVAEVELLPWVPVS